MMQEVTEVTASLAEIDFLLSEVRVTESSSSMGIPMLSWAVQVQ